MCVGLTRLNIRKHGGLTHKYFRQCCVLPLDQIAANTTLEKELLTIMKNTLKRIAAVVICVIMLVCCIGCGRKKPDDNRPNPTNPGSTVITTKDPNATEYTPEGMYTCLVTIDASTAFNNSGLDEAIRNELRNEGMLLNKVKMASAAKQSVTEIFTSACSLSNIVLDIETGEFGSFFKGIGGLYNGDCGENSYWLLKINGEFSDVGADSITVNDGDEIVWIYTCDGGADVGYNWQGQ